MMTKSPDEHTPREMSARDDRDSVSDEEDEVHVDYDYYKNEVADFVRDGSGNGAKRNGKRRPPSPPHAGDGRDLVQHDRRPAPVRDALVECSQRNGLPVMILQITFPE